MSSSIEYITGNLLTADVEALVNAVNTVDVMGKGIAIQFRHAFPENYVAYKAICERGELHPGMMFTTETMLSGQPRFIINFPTKRHWRNQSRLGDIDAGLIALAQEVKAKNIRSIAVPALGCGLGGLEWTVVRPRIEAAFADLANVRVLIFAPGASFP